VIDVHGYTVGQVQENCYIVRAEGSDRAVIVDPGEEAPRLLKAIDDLGVTIAGILVTHTHFDHVGAVAPVAKATGAEVWCPQLELPVLADILLAGLTFDVLFTPGHSPGHVTYAVRGEDALLSGDVLFQGSVGRTDLPGGDWPTLLRSIGELLDQHPDETTVYPGHMGITTLGAERATNPFLAELAQR